MECVRKWKIEGYGHFFACYLLKGQMVDEDSNVDKPLFEAFVNSLFVLKTQRVAVHETVEKCAVKKKSPKETATALYKCVADILEKL